MDRNNQTEPSSERITRPPPRSKGSTVVLIMTLNATVLLSAMNTGMMTVGLPKITNDLQFSEHLQLWYMMSLILDIVLMLNGSGLP